MQAHFLALQGVAKILETVQLVGRRMNPRLKVTGIVLTAAYLVERQLWSEFRDEVDQGNALRRHAGAQPRRDGARLSVPLEISPHSGWLSGIP